MVYRGKELADVAFEYRAGAGVIFGDFGCKSPKAVHCFVCSLPYAARITFIYESAVKVRIEFAVERMVQKSVSDRGFVYVAGLGVGNFEVVVTAMPVSLTH